MQAPDQIREFALKLRTPRNPFEFRGARTALPQNCSPATLPPVWALVNETSVPWEWHKEAKGIHVVGKVFERNFDWAGLRARSLAYATSTTKCASLCNICMVVLNCYGISIYRISRLNLF